MATYIPNATNATQPTEDKTVESAALEFRTLKSSVNTRVDDLQDDIDAEEVTRIAADANLQSQINVLAGYVQGGSVAAIVTAEEFTGDGVTVNYTLTVAISTSNHVDVYLDGVHQQPSSYTVAGTLLTFSQAPLDGVLICVKIGMPIGVGTTDSSLVQYVPAGTNAVPTTVQAKLRETVSVKDFGAVGDGVTDDTSAIQAAVNSGAKRIYFPAGTYYASQSIELPHTGSYYRRDTGQVFFGDGIGTILTRNNTTDTQGATEGDWYQRSFFSCYGSYNEFHELQFYGCPIAIYFGQDPAQIGIEQSHTSFNKMQNLLIQNCGTGFLSACAQGHYYNHYEAIHISQCQIAVYFTVHSSWPTPLIDNNNRNTFLNIRAARCQVGFWLENGDTNSVYSFHCEGCGNTPTNNTYSSPSGLPGGLTTAAFIIQGDNNDFSGCFHESNDFYVYHDALYTQSFGNLFRINNEPAKQNFVTPFYHHFDRDTAWIANGSFARISNVNNAFPNIPAAFTVTQAANGGYAIGNRTAVETNATSNQAFELDYLKPLGAVAALGTVSFTLWSEQTQQTSSSAFFEVTVVGNSQTNNLVHANTFKVVVLRNSSRTPTRYYVYDQVVGRGTGANAGDGTEPIVPSLTLGGTNTRDVILTFTMPNHTFESVSVMVKQLYSRA